LTVVSHVVSPKWRNSLLYHLRSTPLDRRRLVEFGQVISQLLFPRRLMLAPMISFAPPATRDELLRETSTGQVLPSVIRQAKSLLGEHMAWARSIRNR